MLEKTNWVTPYKIALFIYITYLECFYLTNFNVAAGKLSKIILIIVLVLLGLKEYIKLYNSPRIQLRGLILGIIFMTIVYLAFRYTYGWPLMVTYLFVISSRDVRTKDILFPFLYAAGLVIVATILCSQIGLISSYTLYDRGRLRNSMGFLYPSHPEHIFFFWTSAYLVLRGRSIKYGEIVFLSAINFYLYKNALTKDPFFLTLIILLIAILLKLKPNALSNKIYKFVSNCSFLVLPIITYLFVYKFPINNIYFLVDKWTSGRVALAANALDKYGIHMFGQNVHFVTRATTNLFTAYDYVDSGYIQSLVVYGFIFTVVLLFLYTKVILNLNNHNQILLSTILFMIAIYNMADPSLPYLWYNPFLLLCGKFFCEDKE